MYKDNEEEEDDWVKALAKLFVAFYECVNFRQENVFSTQASGPKIIQLFYYILLHIFLLYPIV